MLKDQNKISLKLKEILDVKPLIIGVMFPAVEGETPKFIKGLINEDGVTEGLKLRLKKIAKKLISIERKAKLKVPVLAKEIFGKEITTVEEESEIKTSQPEKYDEFLKKVNELEEENHEIIIEAKDIPLFSIVENCSFSYNYSLVYKTFFADYDEGEDDLN